MKKWGDIRVEIVRINCAKEDAEFLKFLLSSASEQNLFSRGEFVPEGLHLLENTDLVYNILSEQKKYLDNVTSIPLSGLTKEDLLKVTEEETPVKDIILKITGVHSIEKTRERFSPDRWSVIIQKDKETEVIKDIQTKLSVIYKTQTGQKKSF